MRRKLFLVVPSFNEAEVLPVSLPRMLEALDLVGSEELETGLILADDGSSDNTAEAVGQIRDARVQHLILPHAGQQAALLGGIRRALEQGADAVITLDADLQDDPAAIPQMVREWLKGKDVVYAVRSSRGRDSVFKKASAWLFYSLMHLSDRRRIPGHADFRLMSRPCMEALLEKAAQSGDILRNIVPTLGFPSSTVFFSRGNRAAGQSKYTLSKMMGLSWKGLRAQPLFCLALLALVTFAAFFFTSIDSPVHDNMSAHGGYVRHDSAWYFMCGKAWMNGMVPYVDFADSKGPLLWLLYALAYLISPRSWVGVFWINALAYVVTSCLLFKVSLLLTDSTRRSLWMGILLNAFYFIPLFIFDDKSEALTLPFVALSLLMACQSLYGKGGSFYWWGFAFGAIVLIKYSVAAMTGIFLLAMLVKLRSWKAFFKAAGAALAGFATLVGPMLVYLLCVGAFQAFIQEYFIITFQSIDNILGSNDKGEFLRPEVLAYLSVAIAGAVTAFFALKKAKWFPVLALAWFTLCLSKYCRTYYYIPVNALMVFTLFGAFRCFDKDFGAKRYVFLTLLAAALGYFVYTNAWTYRHDYFFGRKLTIQRERPQQYIRLLAPEHHPRVLYWWCGDHGYGIASEDLPACKYWALQAGCTQEMIDNQDMAVKNKLADYVFVETHDTFHQKILVSEGYTRCKQPEFGPYRVYSYRAEEEEDLGYVEDED